MAEYSILDYDARPDAATNNSVAIQLAIDACHQCGGGRVVVPAGGTFRAGSLHLRSGVELHLQHGAHLQASPEPADYQQRSIAGEYGGNSGAFFLLAEDAENVALSGTGTLDGNADAFLDGWWTDDGPYIRKPRDFRPRLIGCYGCRNLSIRNLTIRNAPQWSCHLTGCQNVLISGISILNGLDVPNCDGIDPDHCQDVRISDCHIEAGDDCIVIKNTREHAGYGPTRNITITNCTLVSTSAAIKIGTESVSNFQDIVVSNCTISRSHRGFAIQLRDEGNVERVLVANCTIETRQFHPKWWGNAEAIYLTAVPRHDNQPVGAIRDVRFSNILFRGENGVYLHGSPHSPLRNISFLQVHGTLCKTSRFPVRFHDLRPAHSAEHGGRTEGDLAAFTAHHVEGLRLLACSATLLDPNANHWNGPLATHDVSGLQSDGSDLSAWPAPAG